MVHSAAERKLEIYRQKAQTVDSVSPHTLEPGAPPFIKVFSTFLVSQKNTFMPPVFKYSSYQTSKTESDTCPFTKRLEDEMAWLRHKKTPLSQTKDE